jgi:hypothetical protein
VKGQTNFLNLLLEISQIYVLGMLEQLELKTEKSFGFRNMMEKLEKQFFVESSIRQNGEAGCFYS